MGNRAAEGVRSPAMAQGAAPTVRLSDNELSDPAFWIRDRDYRDAAFRMLRDTPGLRYFDEWVFPDSPFPQGPGYWALARHEDVFAASRNAQLFCSGNGSNIGDLPVELNEFFGSMINMDDPKHFRLRSLVAKGFTPKEVAKVEALRDDQGGRASSTACSSTTRAASATSSSGSRRRCRCRSSAR